MASFEELEENLDGTPPEAVLLDWHFGGRTSEDVLQFLRSRWIPTIILTGEPQDVGPVLGKHVGMETLRSQLAEMLWVAADRPHRPQTLWRGACLFFLQLGVLFMTPVLISGIGCHRQLPVVDMNDDVTGETMPGPTDDRPALRVAVGAMLSPGATRDVFGDQFRAVAAGVRRVGPGSGGGQ